MVFSSLSFLFFFLPLTLGLYYLIHNRSWKNYVLLAASLLFYSWGEPKNIITMVAASMVAYLGTIIMHRQQKKGNSSAANYIYVLTIVLLIANLFVHKYLNFAARNISLLFSWDNNIKEILLPIGISFYTFQILSYVIDFRRGEIGLQKNPFKLLLYVSLFPQLIAGPIVRYQTVEDEISERHESWDDFICGLERFTIGLAKKLILANNLGLICETIFSSCSNGYGSAAYWLAALAYTFQIFFDFSGYSDMAIGLGKMFGFHFLENFNYPYQSLSITEFWRRWHISLSSWFRDYVYIPLGGNRVPTARWLLNIIIVWGLTGIWHGAEWNFILWGLYYGILLIIEKFFLHKLLVKLPLLFRWIYTFFIVVIGWVIFSQTDFSSLGQILVTMFSFVPTDWAEVLSQNSSVLKAFFYLPLGMFFSFKIPQFPKPGKWTRLFTSFILMLICVIFAMSSSYNPFIYFRF